MRREWALPNGTVLEKTPLLGKGGAQGWFGQTPNRSARLWTQPPLAPPLPRRGIRDIDSLFLRLFTYAIQKHTHSLNRFRCPRQLRVLWRIPRPGGAAEEAGGREE